MDSYDHYPSAQVCRARHDVENMAPTAARHPAAGRAARRDGGGAATALGFDAAVRPRGCLWLRRPAVVRQGGAPLRSRAVPTACFCTRARPSAPTPRLAPNPCVRISQSTPHAAQGCATRLPHGASHGRKRTQKCSVADRAEANSPSASRPCSSRWRHACPRPVSPTCSAPPPLPPQTRRRDPSRVGASSTSPSPPPNPRESTKVPLSRLPDPNSTAPASRAPPRAAGSATHLRRHDELDLVHRLGAEHVHLAALAARAAQPAHEARHRARPPPPQTTPQPPPALAPRDAPRRGPPARHRVRGGPRSVWRAQPRTHARASVTPWSRPSHQATSIWVKCAWELGSLGTLSSAPPQSRREGHAKVPFHRGG